MRAALAVALAGALAYANTLDVPLQFDDVPNIVEEPGVHAASLAPADLARAMVGFPAHRWLARGTFAVNHALHGVRPAGYHLVNLAAHLAAALLVLLVARRLLAALAWRDPPDREQAAAVAALLFAVHPVHSQAVTYVVQRMTSLGAVFALLALWLWLGARGLTGRPFALRAGGAALAAWLAFSCKENYAVLPLLALLLEALLDPGLGARLRAGWKAAAAAGALLAAAGAGALVAYAPVIAAEAARSGIPLGERLLTQPRVLWHYLSLLALPLPSRLHVDYAWAPSTGLTDPWTTLPALAGLLGLAALAAWARRRAPLVALGVGWFLVALLVEQTVLPLDLVFEQRVYFAGVGLLLLAACALVAHVRVPRLGPWAAAAPLALLLGAGTLARNAAWADPALLYADEEGTRPGAARGLLTAGATYRQRGDLDAAERVLRRAAALAPGDPGAFVNLGNVALDRGRLAEAERWYGQALARDARNPDVWFDLGILRTRQGDVAGALDAYGEALRLDPALPGARVNLALLLAQRGELDRALAALDEALRLDPGAVGALANRAVLRSRRGEGGAALADAEAAVRIAGDRALPWLALAQVHQDAGRAAAAREALGEALRREPGNADALRMLRALPR